MLKRARDIDAQAARSLIRLRDNLFRVALTAMIVSCADSTGPITISPPTNVTVTIANPGSVRVSWTAPPESDQVLSYTVLRDGAKVGESATTFFVDVGLTEGKTYKYAVSATGILGQVSDTSADSPAATITVPDLTPPTVTSTSPAAGASNMSPAASITVTFSEPVDPASLNSSTFVVKDASGAVVPGAIVYTAGSRTAEFRASPSLPNASTVAVTIATGVKDVAGNTLPAVFTFSFTTRDEAPPVVVSTAPQNGAVGVVVTSPVAVTFSKAMDATTITATSLTVRETSSGSVVAGTVSFDATTRTATFQPGAALLNSTGYTATISNVVKDAAGNSLTGAVSWSFTTAAPQDATPPTVTSVSPLSGAIAVSVNTAVTVAFSEAINPTTINASTVQLRLTSSGATVAGSVLYDAGTQTATFTPAAALAFSTSYTINVGTEVRDLAGNALAAAFGSSFTTLGAPDTSDPTVVSTSPAAGATGVSITGVVTLTFSEPMNASTINPATVSLVATGTGAPVGGGIVYEAATRTVTFQPSAPLGYSTSYTLTVTTGAQDVAGNPMAAPFILTFTTAAPADATPPTIISVSPPNGAANVGISAAVSIVFSELMDTGTINGSTITVRNNGSGSDVAGSVSYNAATNTATFTAASGLAYSTSYTASVSTAAKDVAGNSLANTFTSSFSTQAAPDITPPTVVANSPANGSADVPVTVAPTVTFSEPMNGGTINGSTISLKVASTGAAVAGTVSYNAATNTATFTPSSALSGGIGYTLTVTTAVTDASGNSLQNTFTASFTTVAPPDTTAPTIIAGSPANGAIGVVHGTPITVTFSEPMNAATITGSNIFLKEFSNSVPIAGTVSYDSGNNTATFTPSAALDDGNDFTLNVTTAVSDVAGNKLASNYISTFVTIQHISDPFWQGTIEGGTPPVPGIHFHLNFTQAEDGHTLTLGADCRPLPYGYCGLFPVDQAGADAIGPPSPDMNGGAMIVGLTGTFTDPGITFTVTLENGRTFTFSGTVAGGYTMTLVVSGATLPQTNLILTRSPPFP